MSFYNFAKALVGAFVKCLYKVEYVGLDNVPKDKNFIVASNHRSLMDPIFIALKMPMQLHFMAKKELFFFPFSLVMKGLGAFPVNRGKGDNGAIATAEKILNENKVLAIFPEGTRSKSGNPLPAKSGVVRIADHTKSDSLPVGITFEKNLTLFKKITVRYGEIITFSQLDTKDGKPAEIKSSTETLMNKILDLVDMNITLGEKK
jgi:1-acyl-sn-glycerol-3-phosphate acyltransferase